VQFESWFRSLRFRLSFWTSLVLITLVGMTLLGLRAGMQLALEHELDLLILEDAREMAMYVENFRNTPDAINEELRRKSLSHEERNWFGQIVGSKGEVLFRTPSTPENFPPKSLGKKGPISFERFRVVEYSTDNIGPGTVRILVGSSVDFINEDISLLGDMMLVAWLAIVIVAPLTGYWLAGRATRPLRQILITADKLQPRRMSERLPLSGAGDELDRLCIVINNMLDRLANYLDRQRTFLANAAHELRSPLAAMRAGVEVTLERDRSAPEYRGILEETAEQCSNLTTLVNQLLLLAETDARHLDASNTTVRLDVLAQKTISMFQGVAEQCQIDLTTDLQPVTICGHAHHIRPVLNNLVDNALKYSNPGDSVHLYVGIEQNDPSMGLLAISDTGTGISAEDLPKLFDRFYRTDQARAKDGRRNGTGLGLPIAQSIIEAHGGTIQVDSALGKGTRIEVRLPLAPQVIAGMKKGE